MKGKPLRIIGGLLVGFIFVVLVSSYISSNSGGNSIGKVAKNTTRVLTGNDGFSFDNNTPGYETYVGLIQGCPGGKDCIPSIDNPEFETIDEANAWLEEEDVVFVLDYKGTVRAYPQNILNRHEIVNDVVGEDFIVVTFCPLCGSSLAFDRMVDGQVLEFGVSGKLHNNDLVMYDRETENLWQQITGESIVGDKLSQRLKQIPLSGMRWNQFKEEFPEGVVLARELSASAYEVYPYGNYEQSEDPLFPIPGGVDTTLHPKTVVYGVEIDNSFKAYPEEKIKEEGQISDNIGGTTIVISYNNGNVVATNALTKQEIAVTRLFWFAWKAFRPETTIY